MKGSDIRLKEMLTSGQVFAPCVWDCLSVRAAELSGFEAVLLAGGPVNALMAGFPDIGLITADDLVRQTEFVCDFSSLPVIVDADDGYGETPLTTYRTVRRLSHAGAAAVTIEDSTGFRGYNRWCKAMASDVAKDMPVYHPVVSRRLWLSKIKAAVEASKETGCLVIARTEAKFTQGIEEAIERCNLALEIGCDMTLVMGIDCMVDANIIAAQVPGWKMLPDVKSRNQIPDVRLDEIDKLGFNLVTTHIFERAMLTKAVEIGLMTIADKNTVCADNLPLPNGWRGQDQKQSFSLPCNAGGDDPWLRLENELLNVNVER